MITNFFIPELNNHDVQELWFQQDSATCHTARATIDLLKDTFGDRLISRFGPVNWPPRSCDLTPLDYFLWGYVKSLVYADKPQTLDHLEDNIRRVIADIRPQMLEKVIENWTSRLDYIRASRGSHMPEIIFKICRLDDVIEDPNLPEDDQSYQFPQNPRMEIRKALAHGIPPFPYKVAKTLDPGIYRNVEFDMWNEKRKEDQKNEQFVIPKLEPGVKCKVYTSKDSDVYFIGHVQDIFDDCENVSIYIEELCKKCVVSTSVLEIYPIPAYKALTWQGGKTYKVYSDCMQGGYGIEIFLILELMSFCF
ncbi:putative bifunctional UDP-N-acetylglucosamine transferase and deubiquitinase ALG13 [Trichonephila clavipes]|nr:putative bifunctional UDP-N-acetylglucosamine transferase and deubiquitinase ALG13 [Trichonephila clavipes]